MGGNKLFYYKNRKIFGRCALSHISFDPLGCVAAQSLLQIFTCFHNPVKRSLRLERHSQHLFCPLQKHVAHDDALFTSKTPFYCIQIITKSFSFVKNCLIFQCFSPCCFSYMPKCHNRIFIFFRVVLNFNSKNKFKLFASLLNFL